MAMNLETVLKIKAQVDGANKVQTLANNMGRLNDNSKKTATSFGKLKTASSGLTSALASLGVAALATSFGKAAIDSQRLETRIKTLAGPSGEVAQVMDFAADAAQRFGLGQNTATQAVADLYGRLRPTGVSLDNIKTAFNGVNNAAAQVGLSAAETDSVLLQLSQALGSGTLQGDEFRSVMEQLPAIGQALAKTLNVSIGELKQLGADGKLTTDVVLDALGKLEDIEPPPPDAYKEFTAAVENLSIAFGEQLLPAFQPLVELATNALQLFGKLPDPLKQIVALAGGLAAAAVILAPPIAAIAGLISGGAIATAVTAIGSALAGVVALLTGPLGIALAIGAVLTALYAFRDEIGGFFVTLGDVLASFGETLYDIFVQPFIDAFQAVISFVADSWVGELIEYIGGIFTWFQETFASITELILFPFRLAIELFMDAFVNPIIEMITGAKDKSGNAWAKLGELLEGPFNAVLDFVKDNFIEPMQNAVSGVVEKVKETWSALIEPFKEPFNVVMTFIKEKVVNPVKDTISGLVDALSEIWEKLKDAFIGPFQATIDFLKEGWAALKDVVSAPFTAAADIIRNVINNVIDGVEKTINGAITAVNRLISAANSVAGAVGLPQIQQISGVELPRFANGGLVNGPTMAIVGEGGQPEYIIPQSKADGFAQNWMAGIRGPAAIPRFANGGMVAPSNATVSIQTGPVTQMNGTNYVTTQEMSAAVQAGVKQTLDLIRRDGNTRASLGFA